MTFGYDYSTALKQGGQDLLDLGRAPLSSLQDEGRKPNIHCFFCASSNLMKSLKSNT